MDAKMQQQYAETFHGLHRTGDPLILFNAWDVATAEAIAKGSPAVATSSAAVASALGFADGEHVPFDMVTGLVSRISPQAAHQRPAAKPMMPVPRLSQMALQNTRERASGSLAACAFEIWC